MPAPIIAYIRVSTDKQGKSGLGLSAQRDAIGRFAASEHLEVVAEFVEVESGKGSDAMDKRPQLAAALRKAKQIKAPITVSKLDRLSRDVHFISGLMTKRVPFIVTALGRNVDPFMLHIKRRSPRRVVGVAISRDRRRTDQPQHFDAARR